MSTWTQLKPCRTQNSLLLGSSNCNCVRKEHNLQLHLNFTKECFPMHAKQSSIFPFIRVLLGFLILVDRKRCKSDGSQSYEMAITVRPSQQHLEFAFVKVDDNLDATTN